MSTAKELVDCCERKKNEREWEQNFERDRATTTTTTI